MIEFDKLRYAEYTGMPAVIEPIANCLGIELSEEAGLMQSVVAGIAATLDDILDRGTREEGEAALSYWENLSVGNSSCKPPENVTPQLIGDLQTIHRHMSPAQAGELFATGQQVIDLSVQYSGARSAAYYCYLRAEEARLAFRMMASTVPEAEQQHPRFPQYVELAETAGAIGASLDNVKDLRLDILVGRAAIPLASYSFLVRRAFSETVHGVRKLGLRTTSKMLGAALRHGWEVEKLHYLRGIRHPS